MDRRDFFFRQKVTEAELDGAFDAVENALFNLALDWGIVGITTGAEVTENSGTPNLTVDIAGPATIYDQLGQRISWSPGQDLDASVDENSVATAVTTPGNEKWLSVFAKFVRTQSDPRTDGAGDPLFFELSESFEIGLVQGAEAVAPTATRPPLEADRILLADIRIVFGTTQILNADIDTTRRQDAFVFSAGSVDVRAGTAEEALQSLVTQIGISAVDLSDDTAPDDGATLVGIDAIAGSPDSISQGTVQTAIAELLGFVNVKAALNLVQTFTAAQSFETTIGLGDGTLSTDAEATTPRMNIVGPSSIVSPYSLVLELDSISSVGKARLYVRGGSTSNELVITVNAEWVEPAAQWQRDTAGVSQKFTFTSGGGLEQLRHQENGATWSDSYTGPATGGGGWDNRVRTLYGLDGIVSTNQVAPRWALENGMLELRDPQTGGDADAYSNLARSATPLKNMLYAKTVPKAWGTLGSDGVGGISFQDGFNYTASISGSVFLITFGQAMANSAYSAVANARGAVAAMQAVCDSFLSGSFEIEVWDGTAFTDVSSNVRNVQFVVFGEQTGT